MNKAGEKVRQIIAEEFDGRLEMAVVTYILDTGFERLKEMKEKDILQFKGNALMTDEFVQALVRAAVRICKECHHIDDFLPFIVNYLYVPKAKMHDVEIYQDQMSKWRWQELMNDLDVDFEEEADEIEAVFLKANVISVARKEEYERID
jgi:hypothetical protein